MPVLTSPSAIAFVIDNSIYALAAPTTIPLIVIATRSAKVVPDGTGTALGTIESNRMRQVASQREARRNYGNAVFVTSAGDPVHGDETNEYGLLALDSFLGIANRAYVLRADIDLGGLVPTTAEPVLPPPDGTYWLDSDAVVGGIFKYDGAAWNRILFTVFTTAPTSADGADGNWGADYSTSDGKLVFRNGGSWFAASAANLLAEFGSGITLSVSATSPSSPGAGDFWYKTTASAGGVNLRLSRYRAVDGVFVTQSVLRSEVPPVPNQNTIWEDLSDLEATGARPLYIGTGATFIPLPMYVQPAQPVAEPATGTLWFDDTLTDFALLMEGTDVGYGNQWVIIETTTVSNPTNIQKVISASPPQFPAVGAIWADLSTPEDYDNYPVLKRWSGTAWVDISDSVLKTDRDPVATVVLNGTYWLNLGASITRNTVKKYNPTYVAKKGVFNGSAYSVETEVNNHWEPAAGDTFGRKSQREVIVEAMQAVVVANEEIRAESVYYQLIACPGYPELYNEMIALNADNKEVSFIVGDTPKFMRPSGIPQGREVTAAEWMTNANNVVRTGEEGFSSAPTPYAAFYYPWGIATDNTGNDVMAPPSHAALRTIAYSDSVSAPWWPPAGYTRGRVDNFSSVGYLNNNGKYTPIMLTRSHRDILYENKINPIAFIPNRGLVVFGQKTMHANASALDRVNVARLIAKMKYDLMRLLEPYLFEINDPVTRRSAQVVTERYMAGLKSLRALYDYAVRCDENNNTPDRIDANQLWVDVACKPAKAIEFIYVPITILGTGDQFPF